MIKLTDSIQINKKPETVFDWFMNLDNNFVKWHPNHMKFSKITGGMNVGDIVRFEEKISDKWFKFNVKITKIEKTKDRWLIEAKTPLFATLLFTAQGNATGCVFTHTEIFGMIRSKNSNIQNTLIPILKKIINPIFRFDLIERDIKEDNLNLKRILENN
jgi:hypothetical protein